MWTKWNSKEKRLMLIIVILTLLLLSMLFSSWQKNGEDQQSEFVQQSFSNIEEKDRRDSLPRLVERVELQQSSPRGQEESKPAVEAIMVDIKGAVQKPYVYQMNADERVIDVIQKAGGLQDEASTVSINLAQKVFDGMVIYIPTEKELEHGGEGGLPLSTAVANNNTTQGDANPSATGKVNLNTATATELETLPGIGPSRAKAIISYREEKGSFSSPEELLNVSGIGSKIFANLKDEIEVR